MSPCRTLLAALRSRARGFASTILLAGIWLVAGCVHVKPYQREYLSKPSMSPTDETLETSFQAHLRESREGASAGSSAAGGGCGCN